MYLMRVSRKALDRQRRILAALEAIARARLPITVHGSAALLVIFGRDALVTKDMDVDWLSVSIDNETQLTAYNSILDAFKVLGTDISIAVEEATETHNSYYYVYSGEQFLFKCDIAFKKTADKAEYTLPSGARITCQSIPALIGDRVCSISCDDFNYRVKDMCTLLLLMEKDGFTQEDIVKSARNDGRRIGHFDSFKKKTPASRFQFEKEDKERHYIYSYDQQIEMVTPFLQPFIDRYSKSLLTWNGEYWKFNITGRPYDYNQIATHGKSLNSMKLE